MAENLAKAQLYYLYIVHNSVVQKPCNFTGILGNTLSQGRKMPFLVTLLPFKLVVLILPGHHVLDRHLKIG